MNVITFRIAIISLSKGRPAVQMAAYCGRDRLSNEYICKTYDYTNRRDFVYHEIMLPDHVPEAFCDPEILWNSVEKIEKNRNSCLARSFYYSLPRGLDIETYVKMAENYVQEYFVDRGMCADTFIHDKGDGNPHVH